MERLLGKEAHYDAFVDYSGHDRSERKGKDVESVSKLFQVCIFVVIVVASWRLPFNLAG